MAPPQRFYSQCGVVVCRSHPLSVEELNELVEEALGGAKTSGLTAEYKVSSWSIARYYHCILYISLCRLCHTTLSILCHCRQLRNTRTDTGMFCPVSAFTPTIYTPTHTPTHTTLTLETHSIKTTSLCSADPHSAVRLSDTGVPGSRYINANYITVSRFTTLYHLSLLALY